MKRWEMVAKILNSSGLDARDICRDWDVDENEEIAVHGVGTLTLDPNKDIIRDIVAGMLLFNMSLSQAGMALDRWDQLTGRKL